METDNRSHSVSFYYLVLFVFLSLFNPLGLNQGWIILLFFPVLISLILDRRTYVLWSSALLPIYVFVIMKNPVLLGKQVFLQLVFILISIGVGWVILSQVQQKKTQHDRHYLNGQLESLLSFLYSLVPIVERKTQIPRGEIKEVIYLMKGVLKSFPQEKIEEWEIRLLSVMHYVSRIKLPDYLFEKGDKITEIEYLKIQEHSFFGSDLLHENPMFRRVEEALRYHHERLDGLGYPHQLKGNEIPLLAQILGVVESYVAMTKPRSYRKALSPDVAYEELKKGIGTIFNREIVDALGSLLKLKTEKTPPVAEKLTHFQRNLTSDPF